MVKRKFWQGKIENAWDKRNVIWLNGIRRVGKTFLCRSIQDVEFFDCELPHTRIMMEDPQSFLQSIKGKRIILDEIHRLNNPSEILKITADYFPGIKVIATGSSTLGASRKFKDTLTGRKIELWLTPLISHDLEEFQNNNLSHRLLHGGLPPYFLAKDFPEYEIQEWVDAYWAKDIQELFRLERRAAFQKLLELLMIQSGGIFEATKFSRLCEVSRQTIMNYLKALEATFVIHIVRPFTSHRATEIVAAPKVYGFDTGFICYYKGWHTLRNQDLGILWEHYVLNELHGQLQSREIYYWRDKQGHEIDFVLARRGKAPIAIECKWSAKELETSNIKAFHHYYPNAEFYIVSQDVERTFSKSIEGFTIHYVHLKGLIKTLTGT